MGEVLEALQTTNHAELSQLTKRERKAERFEQNKQTLQLFCEKYPNCFIPYHIRTKERKQPKPLAIGIHNKLYADNPEVPIQHIKHALAIYVSGWAYKSMIKQGAIRVDLQGNPTDDKVTEDEETRAKAYLVKKVARKKATQENHANAAANKKKREDAEKKKTKSAANPASKKQADNPLKSADNNNVSQQNGEVKLVHALKGRATLSLKKKEKQREKETA